MIATPIDVLCSGVPDEFRIFLEYCRTLGFKDKPKYSYLRQLFRDLAFCKGYEYDNQYDWSEPPSGKLSPKEETPAESKPAAVPVEEKKPEPVLGM